MNIKPFISIRIKTLVLLLLSISFSFIIFIAFSYRYIRSTLNDVFVQQSINTMTLSGKSVSDYIKLIDSTARGLYFNSEILDILSDTSEEKSDTQTLVTESKIFDYMQMLYSSIPDASQIHFTAYQMKKSLIVESNMQRYEKDHIALSQEKKSPCAPYHSYVSSTHMQSDYNFTQLANRKFLLVFTLHMPIYKIPSTSTVLGEITIDIPISALEEKYLPSIDKKESLFIIDENGQYVYSSQMANITESARNPFLLKILSSNQSVGKTDVIHDDQDNIIIYNRIHMEPVDWYIIKISPSNLVYAKANHYFYMILFTFIAIAIIEIIVLYFVTFQFTTPLKKATAYAQSVANGNINAHMSDYIVYSHNDELGILLISINKMIQSIRTFTIRQYELELSNRTNELKALQAQINPHFIHNTLQCLATNALENGNLSLYDSICDLGTMMHYSMNTKESLVTISQVLQYIELYIKMQNMRFENSIEVLFYISPESQKMLIPKMSIQPLVENSIKHGNLRQQPNGKIIIKSWLNENILHICVIDTGTGMPQDKMDDLNKRLNQLNKLDLYSKIESSTSALRQAPKIMENVVEKKFSKISIRDHLKKAQEERYVSNSIGIINVYQRLMLYYHGQCSIKYSARKDGGTIVHIEMDYNLLDYNREDR